MAMKRLLHRLARSGIGAWVLGWLFANLSFAVPVDRMYESESLMAFHHPNPSHKLHILIVPKGSYRSILDLPVDAEIVGVDLLRAIKALVHKYRLADGAYRLILNGGGYQEVDLLHFHLISDDIPA